jgi:hypothetical protein
MYVLDCWKAFRAFVRVVTGVVVRDVKKLVAGLLWNDRIAGDLKADFEATASVELSLNGCRIVKAIFRWYLQISINLEEDAEEDCICKGEDDVAVDLGFNRF